MKCRLVNSIYPGFPVTPFRAFHRAVVSDRPLLTRPDVAAPCPSPFISSCCCSFCLEWSLPVIPLPLAAEGSLPRNVIRCFSPRNAIISFANRGSLQFQTTCAVIRAMTCAVNSSRPPGNICNLLFERVLGSSVRFSSTCAVTWRRLVLHQRIAWSVLRPFGTPLCQEPVPGDRCFRTGNI